jgi:hypothetical protein
MMPWSKFGSSLTVSGDVMVVSSPSATVDDVTTAGAAYVFHRDPATRGWVQAKQLVPHDSSSFSAFGHPLALDGDTVAAVLPSLTSWSGFRQAGVYLFGRDVGGLNQWGAVIKITDPVDLAGGTFATSVALAGDLLFVGAVSATVDGMVMIFERHRGGADHWGKIATIHENDLGAAKGTDEAFGGSLAVDGDNLLIGGPPDRGSDEAGDFFWNDNNGAAYLFSRDPVNRDQWGYVARLESPSPDGVLSDKFGLQLALADDTAVVAAQEGTAWNGAPTGAVYVFRRDGNVATSWVRVAQLTADDGRAYDAFGSAIALSGDTLLIGAANKHVASNFGQGGAYLFQRSSDASDTWEQTSMLTASDGQANDEFGTAVALDGDAIVVGSPYREGDAAPPELNDYGGVYLYEPQAPPPPVACQPAFVPTQTLPNVGAVISPTGFLLATAAGTVPAPLPIWILEAQPPAEPLHAGAVPLGLYYNVGAQCTTAAPVDLPFVLGLPVPAGADTSHLAVAVLVSGTSIDDDTSPGSVWRRLTGVYDPARQLFLVSMAALVAEGHTFVLIEDPSVEPMPSTDASREVAGVPRFIVQCKGLDALQCRDEDKIAIEQLLVDAYRSFKLQGFRDPALVNAVPSLGPVTPDTTVTFTYPRVYGAITLESCTDRDPGVLASYNAATKTMVFCAPRLQSADSRQLAARHELFHAVQHAYPNVAIVTEARDQWITEGTAMAAAAWNGRMNRMEQYSLRPVSQSFDDVGNIGAYKAQDFWVHLFTSTTPNLSARRRLPLGELVSFFERGATTASVADRLKNPATLTYGTLAVEYWNWVKNQVIEKTDVTFAEPGKGSALKNPCEIEPDLIGGLGPNRGGFTYSPSRTHKLGFVETSLTSTVVPIHFPVDVENVTVDVEGDSSLAYKVYLHEEDPVLAGCRSEPSDEARTFAKLPAGSIVLVLIANTFHQFPLGLNYDVKVSRGPDGAAVERL